MRNNMFFLGDSASEQPFPTLDAVGDFTDIAVLWNPCGGHSSEIDNVLMDIEDTKYSHRLQAHKLQTSRDLMGNVATLSELPPSTIIGIWSGDGGASKVLDAAHSLGITNPIHIMAGGTKNDMARMAVPSKGVPIDQLLTQGRVAPVAPLLVTVGQEGFTLDQKRAFAYASTGVTDTVARTVNMPEYRLAAKDWSKQQRFIQERKLAARSFANATPFLVEQAGKISPAIDIIVSNGSQMAGGSMKTGSDFLRPEARLIKVRNKFTGALVLGALQAGLPVGTQFDQLNPQTLTLTDAHNAFIQIDGDGHKLPTGEVTLCLEVAATGVRVITTRLR